MITKMVVQLIIIISILFSVESTFCKNPNEIFSSCVSKRCQNTCKNPTASTGCKKLCVLGCTCAAGFLLDENNVCVPPSQCSLNPIGICTGANEFFSACGNDGCQRTCTRQDVSSCVPVCSTPGCVCLPGYVKNGANVCVIPTTCPTPVTCGINEVISACGNDGCQRSCNRLDVSTCIPTCSTLACICITGFVRNDLGACISPSACPPTVTCRTNEVFSMCGNNGCQGTCLNPVMPGCHSTCNAPACICAAGFVKNSIGNCILPSTCPVCGVNEMFSLCGNDGCQRSCTRLDVTTCIPVCNNPACICVTGYVRNATGSCVLPSTCPCGSNEMFSPCGNNGCQPTCAVMNVGICTPICGIPSCICSPGFVKDALNACVLPSNCPITMTCGANQVFSMCGDDGCQPSCSGGAPGCIPICSGPGCICAQDFIIENGMCVPFCM